MWPPSPFSYQGKVHHSKPFFKDVPQNSAAKLRNYSLLAKVFSLFLAMTHTILIVRAGSTGKCEINDLFGELSLFGFEKPSFFLDLRFGFFATSLT